MNIDLRDKVVVVTGSSKGIGKELIKAFAKEGSQIVINYFQSEEAANQLYNQIIKHNKKCIRIKADVTNQADVDHLCSETISTFGRIDVLVNNAGICDDNLIQLMPEEQWRRVIDVNLTGTFLCCRAFSKIMIRQGFGSIINISSLKGQGGCEGQTNYSASKAGLIGFTKSLAKELGMYNISVNALCPGFIVTDLNRHNDEKRKIAMEKSLMSIDNSLHDLLNFILFLSSDRLLGVSGQVFNIDSRCK
ncbi:MAG: 3-oxoacyl-ACP reductase FabG [Oscillospiraceae bacterium]|nr:3-oxoacyl-ACP reductase FabG [Oscillospiraceae bacterium]